ncbi:MAG: maleylpyruvate isomerase family mycothiol-dependent enzyme, partial [Saccharothrix sp.]|nr:maleylpyruvate isomerase family mycothiol-dependent enzyme [Saccharothrix sp.]
MRRDETLAWVKAERLGLTDFLEDLDENEWQADSLRPGWTVRDVAAHLTPSTRTTLLVALRGVIRGVIRAR